MKRERLRNRVVLKKIEVVYPEGVSKIQLMGILDASMSIGPKDIVVCFDIYNSEGRKIRDSIEGFGWLYLLEVPYVYCGRLDPEGVFTLPSIRAANSKISRLKAYAIGWKRGLSKADVKVALAVVEDQTSDNFISYHRVSRVDAKRIAPSEESANVAV